MNNSSTSRAAGAGPPRDLYYPIDSTHVDIGCVACGAFIKLYAAKKPLRELIRRHKQDNPSCFDGSTIDDAYAACSRAIEERVRSKISLFERNRAGDTDPFFNKDEVDGFKCSRCNKCFEKEHDANDHVRSGRTQCSGCDITGIACRKTIFGTLCPAPLACRRQRFELEVATVPMSAAADTETRRSLPMDLPSDEATAGTGSTIQTPAPSRRLAYITPGTVAPTATTPCTPMIAAAAAPDTPVPHAPAPTLPVYNPYCNSGVSRHQFKMSQSNNPAVQRALRAVRSQSFPPEETTWQTAIRLVKRFVPIGHAADDYAHIHADLGRPEDIVAVLTKVHKLGDVASGPDSTFVIIVMIRA